MPETPRANPRATKEDKPSTATTQTEPGKVGDDQVIDAQEHVLGDDPRRVEAQTESRFHDTLSGRPVDKDGRFLDAAEGEEAIPPERITTSMWIAEDEAK